MKNNSRRRRYGHSPASALFPLFESDKEYELITEVLSKRFPNSELDIRVMYKYLASQHLPLIVLFSSELPYGVLIKKLPPNRAWNEVFCNKILAEIHPFDFDIRYHKDLECISEKYLPGCDIIELPAEILSDIDLVNSLFYWQGKCAGISYIFGIGDRGHNERLHYNESEDLARILSRESKEDPIINIDFEYFPSIRLTNPGIEVSEIAISFYVIFQQLPLDLKINFENLFSSFFEGFNQRIKEINESWDILKENINNNLTELFSTSPQDNSRKFISVINKRATETSNENIYTEVLSILEKEQKKPKTGLDNLI